MLRRRILPLLFVLVCLGVPTLAAQQTAARQPAPASAAQPSGGPRIQPEFQSYKPAIAGARTTTAAAAAADRMTITITTLGLILLIVLLIVLIA